MLGNGSKSTGAAACTANKAKDKFNIFNRFFVPQLCAVANYFGIVLLLNDMPFIPMAGTNDFVKVITFTNILSGKINLREHSTLPYIRVVYNLSTLYMYSQPE